jgi:cytochrome b
VRIPQAGRISEEVEGKRVRKEEETNHRSRRAPERLDALKWVKSEVEGRCKRHTSWRPKGSLMEVARAS